MIQTGWYNHFKGGVYIVTGVAEHTETGEQLVLYYLLGNHLKVWARPVKMFEELVEYEGKTIPRFQFVHS